MGYYIFSTIAKGKYKMKKRLAAIIMTVVVLASTACLAFAKGGVELPMIPIQTTNPISVKLSSDADSYAYSGDSVMFTTNISDIGENGISKAELEYSYSDGLVFNNDVKVIGLPTGWQISEAVNANSKLSFTVSDVSGENPVMYRNLDITFSFKVSTVSGSQQSVNFSKVVLYDKQGVFIDRISEKFGNNTFTTEASIPEVSNIGASLRINNTPALRFGMTVSKDECFLRAFPNGNFVYSNNADMKFGMLIIEESSLRGELTVATSGVTEVIFEEIFSETNNEILFVHTLDNVTNYTKNYTFRPFVVYRETPDGEYQYHYGESKTRSARTVAQMELLSETSNKKIEMLNKFVG